MDINAGFVEAMAEAASPSGGAAPGLTEELPPDLPMQYPCERSEFYVRECYPRYYGLVLHELFTRDKRCVTVTGSPGTGKSVFYGYFFNHFTREEQYRGFTIITASFTKYSDLQDIAVFENERKGPRIIHLYDGPPRISPQQQKMVCFTSPNERWLDSLYKDFSQTTLYMPLWDEDELFAAATSLRIDSVITRAVIDKRIGLFGLAARECLSQRESFVENRLKVVQQTIEEMGTLEPQRLYVRRRVLEKINVVVSFEEFANGYKQLRCNPQAAMDRGFSFLLKTYDLVRRGVPGQALVTVLEKLELLKKALKNPRSVRLILVALALDENKWKFKKRIQWDLLLNAENVDIIPGVDTSQLKAINVETVKDLRTAIDAPSAHQRDFFSGGVLTHYSTILKSFDERQNAIETMLTKIPMYVLEV
ncbi:uncharacterized protein PITG_00735 [Phytophthora infestans T30-4]|uniref:Crinkler (CRN) family protein n=1 Tax=Phytophthora infestans (strain T30-4) TaxID=403677 RepID=D0MRK3_PHYIT|nr:uncharacterized protein PITG_00735 [Phytophthora infestans T30-4]EEY58122.1 conserved hypothetical protein [Phytophthora infestans T30-4]|eukprot:XP_002909308.1 conserved hypothetical protein [Phytophthora infestans T30-4]